MTADTHTASSVLCVDDDGDFLEILERELVTYLPEGSTVHAVSSVSEALDSLRTESVDCVVTDYAMPQATGLELVDTIRARDPSLPVVFLTGRGNESVAADAMEAGVGAYVVKGSDDMYRRTAVHVRNLVARRRAEVAAETATRRIRQLYERISDGLVTVDDSWRVTDLNEHAARFFDVTREEALGTVLWDVFPDFKRADLRDTLHEAMTRDERARLALATTDGRHAELTAHSDVSGMTIFVHDVTTEVNAQAAIAELESQHRRTEERFRALANKLSRPEPPFR